MADGQCSAGLKIGHQFQWMIVVVYIKNRATQNISRCIHHQLSNSGQFSQNKKSKLWKNITFNWEINKLNHECPWFPVGSGISMYDMDTTFFERRWRGVTWPRREWPRSVRRKCGWGPQHWDHWDPGASRFLDGKSHGNG